MHRDDHPQFRVAFDYTYERPADILKRLAPRFTAVSRDQHERRALRQCPELFAFGLSLRRDGIEEGVDHRIAGDADPAFGHPLSSQVIGGQLCRREAPGHDLVDQDAVHLFREGQPHVPAAQPRFDVADRDVAVKGGKPCREGRRRVSVHEYGGGFDFVEVFPRAGEHG
ncbi:hypothetical protein SDC9_155722 [bioreactor metagenome]|uniref:Uncharacterized protein n=1 Tax=bioreactor metagenome TaxID=1076179 RepID=A0A645F3L7_9ZZZZ